MSCCTKGPFLNTLISSIKNMYDTNIYILLVKITDKYYLIRSWDSVRIYSLSVSHFLFRKSNYVTMTYENTQNKKTSSAADNHR